MAAIGELPEFTLQGDTQEEVDGNIQKAYDYLDANGFKYESNGKTHILKGGFSYGTGKDLAEAERRLKAHKIARELSGDRTGRGEKPPGYREGESGRNADKGEAGQDGTKSLAEPEATGYRCD